MGKPARFSAATKIILALLCCGPIILAVSGCDKKRNAQETPGEIVEASDGPASVWASVFPDGLMDSDGVDVSLASLEGKTVGLYFSASWCVPCHVFTPQLVEFRNQHQEHFEVVLVGRDSAEGMQLKYMKEHHMPFPATKWGNDRNTQSNQLKEKYKASAIPRLVILSSEGKLVIEDAREAIESTPDDVAELFTNKQKMDELSTPLAQKAESEIQDKIQAYETALQEKYPRLAKDHKSTPIAHYTFDSTADDVLKKNSAFTLKNTTYENGALSLNGIYSRRENGYDARVFLEGLNYAQFSTGQEFLIRDHSKEGARKSTSIIVGGYIYRWFGLKCYPTGEVDLFFNTNRFIYNLPGVKVTLNEWNRVLVSVDLYQGVARIWFNGKLLPEVKLPEDFMLDVIATPFAERDANFNFTNFSNAETLDGMVDNVVFFDGPLSESEMEKEATTFGSRWRK